MTYLFFQWPPAGRPAWVVQSLGGQIAQSGPSKGTLVGGKHGGEELGNRITLEQLHVEPILFLNEVKAFSGVQFEKNDLKIQVPCIHILNKKQGCKDNPHETKQQS